MGPKIATRPDTATLGLSALLGLFAGGVYAALGARNGALQFLAICLLGVSTALHRRVTEAVSAPRYLFWAVMLVVGCATIYAFWPWMGDPFGRHHSQYAYGAVASGCVALIGLLDWRFKTRRPA